MKRIRRVGGWAGRVVGLMVVLLTAYPATRLTAQVVDTVPKPRVPSLVRYGKWVALAGAGVLGTAAYRRNQDAEATYQALRSRCFDLPLSCTLGPDGRYTDPVSEGLYSETQRSDREAARFLIGAEVAVAAAAVGFVWELMHREDRPPTIPFEPRIEAGLTTTRVGLTFHF